MAAFTNELGRYYERGKCLNKDMKGDIVDYILTNGGDSRIFSWQLDRSRKKLQSSREDSERHLGTFCYEWFS